MKLAAEFRGLLSGLALVAIVLLLAIDAPSLIPGQELLQSLRFHIAIAVVPLLILLFLSRAWWRGLALLLVLGASVSVGGWIVYQQQRARPTVDAVAQVDVLSFNVLAPNRRGPEIADYILETTPDVAIIMESNAIVPQIGRLASLYPHRAGCNAQGTDCDLMIFSRTPLSEVRVFGLEPFGRLRLVTAKTVVDGQSVTIVGVHLSKPYFDESAWSELYQTRDLLRQIEGPVILAGDFNAAAWSDNVAHFAADMGLAPPPFYPATWPVRAGALGVPIDNMFTRGNAVISSIGALDDSLGSNHRGLRALVELGAP